MENSNEFGIKREEYRGKVSLLITYQWNANDFSWSGDSIILDKNFDTIDEAYAEMEKIMPDAYDWDDGDDFEYWNAIIDEIAGDPSKMQPFVQYAYSPDSRHCMLAVFRPA